jgi:HSP20 family protein
MFRREAFAPFVSEFNRVQEEFDRLFAQREAAGPRLNLWQDADAVFAELDLPGFDPAKLDVHVTDGNVLTVAGERAAAEVAGAVWVRQERPVGTFTRTVKLPALVDADQVTAKYELGVLKLTLPKSAAAKPRKIAVQA